MSAVRSEPWPIGTKVLVVSMKPGVNGASLFGMTGVVTAIAEPGDTLELEDGRLLRCRDRRNIVRSDAGWSFGAQPDYLRPIEDPDASDEQLVKGRLLEVTA